MPLSRSSHRKTTHCKLNAPTKNHVIGCIKGGSTVSDAARVYSIPQPTYQKLWEKYQKTGSTSMRPGRGRPKLVDDNGREKVEELAKKHCRMPFAELVQLMVPPIGGRTVVRELDTVGMHRRKPREKLYLRAQAKGKRLEWAREHKHFTDLHFSKVYWPDESYVCIGNNPGTVYVTRTANEVFEEDCTIYTFKQLSVWVMVWSCIVRDVKGPLILLKYLGGKGGGMNADRYQEQGLEKFQEF